MKSQNFFLQIHVIINLFPLFFVKIAKSKGLLWNIEAVSQCDSLEYSHTLHNGIVTTPVCLSHFTVRFSFCIVCAIPTYFVQ